MMAGVTFVALSGLAGVSHRDPGASAPDVTPAQALAGVLLTLLSQFVGAPAPPKTAMQADQRMLHPLCRLHVLAHGMSQFTVGCSSVAPIDRQPFKGSIASCASAKPSRTGQ